MLIIDIAESVGTITLDRDSRRNALCWEMVQAFGGDAGLLYAAGVRCVVLRARPGCKFWSAGHDIDELPAASLDPLAWRDPLRKLIRDIEAFPAQSSQWSKAACGAGPARRCLRTI